jgi:hypothetical protein
MAPSGLNVLEPEDSDDDEEPPPPVVRVTLPVRPLQPLLQWVEERRREGRMLPPPNPEERPLHPGGRVLDVLDVPSEDEDNILPPLLEDAEQRARGAGVQPVRPGGVVMETLDVLSEEEDDVVVGADGEGEHAVVDALDDNASVFLGSEREAADAAEGLEGDAPSSLDESISSEESVVVVG